LRAIRNTVDAILYSMAKDFDGTYAKTGRTSGMGGGNTGGKEDGNR